MRRRRIVIGCRHPIGQGRHQQESFGWRNTGRRELIPRLRQGDAIQPHDVIVVVGQRGMAGVVRRGRVRLKVSVDRGVRMVGVGLVQMLRRNRCREGKRRRQDQSDKRTAE
jgi:hypothetical protein